MKFANALLWALFLTAIFSLGGCSGMDRMEQETKKELSFDRVERHDVLYTCSCGQNCNCKTVSTKPGKCDCGRPLKWGHVLKIRKNEAILFQCGEGCRCYGIDPQYPSRCTCGVLTKKISLVGTGIYFCNCGGSCFCNYVSDSPGVCKCSNNLIKAG